MASKGSSLESLILFSQQGVRVMKVPNGVRWLRGGNTVPCKGPVDFIGVVVGTGRMMLFDAKQCDLVHRFPVGNTSSVSPHQVEQLIVYGREGAVSGLLVESTRAKRLYWCPWQMLVKLPPSYGWDELMDIGPSNRAVDWRKVINPAVSGLETR